MLTQEAKQNTWNLNKFQRTSYLLLSFIFYLIVFKMLLDIPVKDHCFTQTLKVSEKCLEVAFAQ